jgi:DUF1009 family protein
VSKPIFAPPADAGSESLSRLRDKKDDAILRAVAEEIEEGMEVISPIGSLEHLAWMGCWTERKPTGGEKDMAFGRELARQMGALDVGRAWW